MRDDKRSHRSAKDLLQPFLHSFFRGGIERRCGFVDDHEYGFTHGGCADHQPLLLSAG